MSQSIIKSVRTNSAVGVAGGTSSVPVKLNQPNNLWTITPQRPGVVKLRIGDFKYTGVDQNAVIASNDPSQDLDWLIITRPMCGYGHKAYAIGRGDDTGLEWTLFEDTQVIRVTPSFDVQNICNPSKLFFLD